MENEDKVTPGCGEQAVGEETAEELIDALRGKGMDDAQIAALLESALKEIQPKPDGDGDDRKSAEDLFGMKFAD